MRSAMTRRRHVAFALPLALVLMTFCDEVVAQQTGNFGLPDDNVGTEMTEAIVRQINLMRSLVAAQQGVPGMLKVAWNDSLSQEAYNELARAACVVDAVPPSPDYGHAIAWSAIDYSELGGEEDAFINTLRQNFGEQLCQWMEPEFDYLEPPSGDPNANRSQNVLFYTQLTLDRARSVGCSFCRKGGERFLPYDTFTVLCYFGERMEPYEMPYESRGFAHGGCHEDSDCAELAESGFVPENYTYCDRDYYGGGGLCGTATGSMPVEVEGSVADIYNNPRECLKMSFTVNNAESVLLGEWTLSEDLHRGKPVYRNGNLTLAAIDGRWAVTNGTDFDPPIVFGQAENTCTSIPVHRQDLLFDTTYVAGFVQQSEVITPNRVGDVIINIQCTEATETPTPTEAPPIPLATRTPTFPTPYQTLSPTPMPSPMPSPMPTTPGVDAGARLPDAGSGALVGDVTLLIVLGSFAGIFASLYVASRLIEKFGRSKTAVAYPTNTSIGAMPNTVSQSNFTLGSETGSTRTSPPEFVSYGSVTQLNAIDGPSHGKILLVGLCLIDFIGDWGFMIERWGYSQRNEGDTAASIVATLSLIFLVVPMFINFAIVVWILKREFSRYEMRVWFARNSAIATGTILFSIGNVDAISLLGSRVLGSSAPNSRFNAPLTDTTLRHMQTLGMVGNFLEDIPQLCLQIIVLSRETQTTIVLLAIITSALTLAFGIVRRLIFFLLFREEKKDLTTRRVRMTAMNSKTHIDYGNGDATGRRPPIQRGPVPMRSMVDTDAIDEDGESAAASSSPYADDYESKSPPSAPLEPAEATPASRKHVTFSAGRPSYPTPPLAPSGSGVMPSVSEGGSVAATARNPPSMPPRPPMAKRPSLPTPVLAKRPSMPKRLASLQRPPTKPLVPVPQPPPPAGVLPRYTNNASTYAARPPVSYGPTPSQQLGVSHEKQLSRDRLGSLMPRLSSSEALLHTHER